MLETQTLDGVRELDVDAQVVAVGLQGIARPLRLVLLDVHEQPGQGSLDLQAPVDVAGGVALETDGGEDRGGGLFHAPPSYPKGDLLSSIILLDQGTIDVI
jgi:hypothetical protein